MTFYSNMQGVALRLIDKFGQTITLRDTVPGEYDPVTGGSMAETIVDQPAQAILQDYALQQSGMAYAEGTVIKQGDKKILVAAQGLTPPTLTTTVIVAKLVGAVVIDGEAIRVSPSEPLDERITEMSVDGLAGTAEPGAEVQIMDADNQLVASGVADISGLWSFLPNPLTGKSWTIVNIKEINPAGTPLVYEIQGRR